MKITKVFNNNCVATISDGKEVIITGSGIGFQKKLGDLIDENKIEKKFSVMDDKMADFEHLLDNISIDYFESTRAIVEYAYYKYDMKLSNSVNLSLTDHISYAVLRAREGLVMPGLFSDELRLFYPQEYAVAEWGLEFLNKKYNVSLPQDEVAYMAIHIVNARDGDQSHQAQDTLFFIREIIKIISDELGEVNKDSLAYTRLTTHLKYLAQRVFGKEFSSMDSNNNDMAHVLSTRFKEYSNCTSKIASFIEKSFEYTLSLDEKMYLSIHLYQIMNKR